MKKLCLFLLAIVLLFAMCACEADDPVSPTDGTTSAPSAETTLPPETTLPELLWDPAIYEPILEEAQREFSDSLDICHYLLYDITHDQIPELMLKTGTSKEDSSYRIFTIRDGATFLLGQYDASLGELCGYHSGDGILICDMTHHDALTYVMLVTCSGEALNTEVVLDHYEFIKNRFTPLDTWSLEDNNGLTWKSNPDDISKTFLDSLRKEELRLHTDLLDTFSDEELSRLNDFLTNFSQQYLDDHNGLDRYVHLTFVYNYCAINRQDLISYANGYAYITLEDANGILKEFFDITLAPKEDPESYIDYILDGNDILYQDGKLRYTATTAKKYNYVTFVTELIEGKGGTYELYFSVYDIGNNAPEQYYGLRPDEIAQHPEIKNVYWGFATVKPYVRADGTPSYQLVSYTPITYNQ